jgi:hypothetical protein
MLGKLRPAKLDYPPLQKYRHNSWHSENQQEKLATPKSVNTPLSPHPPTYSQQNLPATGATKAQVAA